MGFTTLKIRGIDAIQLLNEHRSQYTTTGQYPFLIGDSEELVYLEEAAELNDLDPATIIRASFEIETADWIEQRRKQADEYGFSAGETLGEWPGEIIGKGSIGLHKDVLSKKIKPEINLGLATVQEPWHLPAVVKYGGWNECPAAEVHCAFYRRWQDKYGAEIVGMSGDVVECTVANPPSDQDAATTLAWEQYWYCTDIIEQGCGSVLNLAATLIDSPYWYFWWD